MNAIPSGVNRLTYWGEIEGVYAAGRTPADTNAGVFHGEVTLNFSRTNRGAPAEIGGFIENLEFTSHIGEAAGNPIDPGNWDRLAEANLVTTPSLGDKNALVTLLNGAYGEKAGDSPFTVTGLRFDSWIGTNPNRIDLAYVQFSGGVPREGSVGVSGEAEFQLKGTGPSDHVDDLGYLWKTKPTLNRDGTSTPGDPITNYQVRAYQVGPHSWTSREMAGGVVQLAVAKELVSAWDRYRERFVRRRRHAHGLQLDLPRRHERRPDRGLRDGRARDGIRAFLCADQLEKGKGGK